MKLNVRIIKVMIVLDLSMFCGFSLVISLEMVVDEVFCLMRLCSMLYILFVVFEI